MRRTVIGFPWLKTFSTFRARIFWSVIPIVLSLFLLLGGISLWWQKGLAEEEFMKRGQAMATNLASSSELGVLAEDGRLLESAMRGVVGDPDVAYVFIYREDGKILVKGGTQVSALPWRSVEEKAQRFVEFSAPILSKPVSTPEELLIGSLGQGPGQGRQRTIGTVRIGLSPQSVEAHVMGLLKLWGGLTVVFFALSTVAIYAFSRRITRPIKQLTDQAEKIAAGQRSVKVEMASRDEIGRLANSFNKMVASLEENEAALERKVVETRTLYEIGQEITAQVAFEPILQLIVERARELLHAEMSLLALRQEGSDTFERKAYSGTVPEVLAGVRFRPGEGLGGRVAATGMPIVVGDYVEEYPDSPFLEIVKEVDVRSGVAVPLKARDVVIGVLYVRSRAPHQFGAEDQQLLSALADQAALAIEQARLYEATKRHAEELEQRVEERTQALQAANLQLEAASRHKSQFLANMSHELRTPLNAILGYAELILDEIYGEVPETIREVLVRVDKSGRHLLGLINDVLDISKIEAGELTLSLNDYSMKEVAQTVFTAVESLAAEKKLALEVTVSPDLPRGWGDERRIAQVLLNLVGNAIKFTEVGEVRIQAQASDGRVPGLGGRHGFRDRSG
jgi:signal transduction histidine kinase